MAEIDAVWFRDRLAEKKLSQRGLARLLGCDHASVHRLIRGKRPMRMQEAAQLAALLGVDVSEIITHAGVQVGPAGNRTVALMGWVDGEGEVHIADGDRERIDAPPDLPEDAMAVRVKATDGPLIAFDGWIYFIAKPDEPTPDLAGRYAVVEIENGVNLLRFVRRGYRPGTWNLMPMGSSIGVENARLEWAAPVLWIRPA